MNRRGFFGRIGTLIAGVFAAKVAVSHTTPKGIFWPPTDHAPMIQLLLDKGYAVRGGNWILRSQVNVPRHAVIEYNDFEIHDGGCLILPPRDYVCSYNRFNCKPSSMRAAVYA